MVLVLVCIGQIHIRILYIRRFQFVVTITFVPGVGLEPTRHHCLRILSPLCLPFHHPGNIFFEVRRPGRESNSRIVLLQRTALPLGHQVFIICLL